MLAESIIHAVNLANDLRKAFGEDILPDLPPSMPGDSNRCVLAAAFNFNCSVTVASEGWEVRFSTEHAAQAEKLAELLGTEVREGHRQREPYYTLGERTYEPILVVTLPDSIGEIARQFDDEALPARYYQSYRGTEGDRPLREVLYGDVDDDVDDYDDEAA